MFRMNLIFSPCRSSVSASLPLARNISRRRRSSIGACSRSIARPLSCWYVWQRLAVAVAVAGEFVSAAHSLLCWYVLSRRSGPDRSPRHSRRPTTRAGGGRGGGTATAGRRREERESTKRGWSSCCCCSSCGCGCRSSRRIVVNSKLRRDALWSRLCASRQQAARPFLARRRTGRSIVACQPHT